MSVCLRGKSCTLGKEGGNVLNRIEEVELLLTAGLSLSSALGALLKSLRSMGPALRTSLSLQNALSRKHRPLGVSKPRSSHSPVFSHTDLLEVFVS